MRATYAEMVAESTPGRLEGEGPMTAYIYDLVQCGGDDEDAGDADFGWASRVGKRILWGTSTGFLILERYPNEATARAVFDDFAAACYGREDE